VDNNIRYHISFQDMCQYNSTNRFRRRSVVRVGPKLKQNRSQLILSSSNCILRVDDSYPLYWKQPFEEFIYTQVPTASDTFNEINRYFQNTIVTHNGRHGFVAGLQIQPTSFEVKEIFQVQSKNLWTRYVLEKARLLNEYKSAPLEDSPLGIQLVNYPLLTPVLDRTVNEVYLFHGTSVEVANLILEGGFESRHVSEVVTGTQTKAMFGAGCYFAENSSKSNQYAPCPICRNGAIPNRTLCHDSPEMIAKSRGYVMIFARVLLGYGHVCMKYDEKIYKKDEPPQGPNGPCDSVMAESRTNGGDAVDYREFVVYNPALIYPEYVVHYTRHYNEK